jgi:hypothetical protein
MRIVEWNDCISLNLNYIVFMWEIKNMCIDIQCVVPNYKKSVLIPMTVSKDYSLCTESSRMCLQFI